MPSKRNVNSRKRDVESQIWRRKRSSKEQSIKKKIALWLQDNSLLNKKSSREEKRNKRQICKNSDLQKSKPSQWMSTKRNKRRNSNKKEYKNKNWPNRSNKPSREECFYYRDRLNNKQMLLWIWRKVSKESC